MKKRVSVILILMLALALCLSAAAMATVRLMEVEEGGTETTTVRIDSFDEEDGSIKKGNSQEGVLFDETVSIEDNRYYIVKGNVVIDGDLTISGGAPKLVLCENAMLTVNGSLILNCQMLEIYGSTDSLSRSASGVLSVNSTDPSAPAVKSTHQVGTSNRTTIFCVGGKLAVQSASGILTEKVTLRTPLNAETSIQKYTLDGEIKLPKDWSGWSFDKLEGSSLTIEYCKHDHAAYVSASESTHKKNCPDCGFVGTAKACADDQFIVGYVSSGENGHYLKCACGNKWGDLDEHDKRYLPTDNGKKHIFGCGICDWTEGDEADHTWNDDGKCVVCDFKKVAVDSKNWYCYLEDAFENVADGDTITLTADITDENLTFGEYEDSETLEWVKYDKSVTLVMNGHTITRGIGSPALTVSSGSLTIADNATITAEAIEDRSYELKPAAAVKVTDGTLTFKGDVTATGGESYTAAAPAIEVSGGTVTFEGNVTAKGGAAGYPSNKIDVQPAIYATGGVLDFKGTSESQGELVLNGGLTVTGSAVLQNKLTQGTFYLQSDKGSTVDGRQVSVVDSDDSKGVVYKGVSDLLEDGYAFVGKDDPTVFYCMNASYGYCTWNVTIVSHKHTWEPEENSELYACSGCGKTCAHLDDYVDGKCPTCGKPCPHALADQSPVDHNYYCNDCGTQMFARIQTDTYKWSHFTNLVDAMAAAEDGQTILLLGDVNNYGQYAILTGDDKTVTLDLNGNTINGGWIFVGINRNRDNYTSTTLNVIGSGSFLTSGNLSVGYTATLDLSGWESGTISTLNTSKSGNDESALIVGEKAGTINSFQIFSWPTDAGDITYIKNTKLRGGTYNRISITMNSTTGNDKSIPFSSMLADGYAFQYVDSGEFVDYVAKAEYGNGGGNLNNVRVVKCTTHVDKKDGGDGYCDYCNTKVADAQAKVVTADGEIFYCDLTAAIAKVNAAGGTVTMQNDVSGLKETLDINHSKPFAITLDLNGHTISGTGSKGSTFLAVSTYSTVTICDSSEGKTGKIESTGGGDYAVHVSSGKLIIEGGTFVGADSGTGIKGRALGARDAELVTITGGTFNSDVELKDSPVEISGGTFSSVAVALENRPVKISGGTFSSLDLQCSSVKISGGTFASLKIDRGTIPGLLEKGYVYDKTFDNFATSVSDVSVVPCKHESGVNTVTNECTACGLKMTLKKEVKDGETTTTTYGTDLAAVLNDAPSGAVVTLLDDIPDTGTAQVEIRVDITIDLNGHTLDHGNTIDVYGKLSISGSGNVKCSIYAFFNGSLDLSGWESGTIDYVNLQTASAGLKSGRGTIELLELCGDANDKFHNISLNSGTYNKISKRRTQVLRMVSCWRRASYSKPSKTAGTIAAQTSSRLLNTSPSSPARTKTSPWTRPEAPATSAV